MFQAGRAALSRCQELRLLLLGQQREWPWAPGHAQLHTDTLLLLSRASVSAAGWDKGLWEGCQWDELGMPDSWVVPGRQVGATGSASGFKLAMGRLR